jgi:hypothetical protein
MMVQGKKSHWVTKNVIRWPPTLKLEVNQIWYGPNTDPITTHESVEIELSALDNLW